MCIERFYGTQVIANSIDKIINIFGQRFGKRTFSFNKFLISTRWSTLNKFAIFHAWHENGSFPVHAQHEPEMKSAIFHAGHENGLFPVHAGHEICDSGGGM